jgi:hypothetical protein
MLHFKNFLHSLAPFIFFKYNPYVNTILTRGIFSEKRDLYFYPSLSLFGSWHAHDPMASTSPDSPSQFNEPQNAVSPHFVHNAFVSFDWIAASCILRHC